MLDIYDIKKSLKNVLYSKEKQVAHFIPYTRHLDSSTIATKEGYLIKIIKIEGCIFETEEEKTLEIKRKIHANLLKNISQPNIFLYHHIIRRKLSFSVKNNYKNRWCAQLNLDYQTAFKKKQLFTNEHFLTIISKPSSSNISLLYEIGRAMYSNIDQELWIEQQKTNLRKLEETTHNILQTLSPLNPSLLTQEKTRTGTYSECLSFLSYLLHFEHRRILVPSMPLYKYLPYKRISFGKEVFEIRGPAYEDIKFGSIVSLKEYPPYTNVGFLDTLLTLPHEFVATQSFGFIDPHTALLSTDEAKRKLIASEQGAKTSLREVEEAKDSIASGTTCFGHHHLSLTLTAGSIPEISEAISATTGLLVQKGITCVREELNLEASFWANLPGNQNYIARKSLISNENFSCLSSFHTHPSGKKYNNHWGDYITLFETSASTPYWFNFHDRDVGNFIVIGPTGSGKTVLLTFLLAQSQKLSPHCFYFDKDKGAEACIRALGGKYITIQPGTPSGLNPLTLPNTAENKKFLQNWIKSLIANENKRTFSALEEEIITDAIEANYKAPFKHRRLEYFSELLSGYTAYSSETLDKYLAQWHSQGNKAWLFDNEKDELDLTDNKKNIGFDLTSILDDPTLRTPWIMYILHRINLSLDGKETLIILDEGWKALDDSTFSGAIKNWLKTIRKKNGVVGFATQSISDAINSHVNKDIIEQSPTQIFFPNPKATKEDYMQSLGVTQSELQTIQTLPLNSRYFVLKQGNQSTILKLNLDSLAHYMPLLSSREQTLPILKECLKEFGENPKDWIKPYTERCS